MDGPLNGPAVTCIGVDVGGTFTDVVLSDGTRTWRAKAPSTPGELGRGVLDACPLVAERAGTAPQALLPTVSPFRLRTTAVTNTIASRTSHPGRSIRGGAAPGHRRVQAQPVRAAQRV